MSTHTPAPWTIEEYGDDETPNLVIHRGETENRICFMAMPGSHGDPAMIEADARLIAAAPNLLNTLNSIVQILEVGGFVGDDLLDKASAAIAKATGETK